MAKTNLAVPVSDCDHPANENTATNTSEEDVSLNEVLHLAQSSVETLKNFLDGLDHSVTDEFHEIMEKIDQTRQDMVHLNIKDQDDCPISDAENELKLVVKATEEATNRIMGAAETIMTADPVDSANYHVVVEQNIMEIFEACSFQDITGQRINRVVETLEFVDYRVHKIARLLGIENNFGEREFDEEAFQERRKRKDDLILHGPQNTGDGVSQDAIDDLF